MIAIVARAVKSETVGTGVEIAHDKSWAKLRIYVKAGPQIELNGTPREIRRVARAITEGLKSRKP